MNRPVRDYLECLTKLIKTGRKITLRIISAVVLVRPVEN